MSLASGTRLGPYEIVGPLGAGGMGEVYRARDTRLGRAVAIKMLGERAAMHPARREQLAREAQVISALAHPHLCSLYDFGRSVDNGAGHTGDYLVMELVEGETLQQRLLRGPLPVEQALRYATQIAQALDHAHCRGVVHRDLKPSNVMLTPAGVKLLDFGIARRSESAPAEAVETCSVTAEHTISGTIHYMAPEQATGSVADARADIFAFGVMLYEMLSGVRPFQGDTAPAVVKAILSEEPGPVSRRRPSAEIPAALDHLVSRCLAKDPEERWQSARDLATQLAWVGGALNVPGSRIRRQTRPSLVLGVALLAVVAIVAAAVAGRLGPPASSRAGATVATPLHFSIEAPPHVTFAPSGGFMALSPDGRSLAFVATATRAGGKPSLWIRRLDRGSAYELEGTDGAAQPFWSADSRQVAFSADSRLKRIDASGGTPTTICEAPDAMAGTWNQDGVILFWTIVGDGLYRVPASGGTPIPVTRVDRARGERAQGWPQFLPDGRHFLYAVARSDAVEAGIFVGSLDSAERWQVVAGSSNAQYVQPGYLVYTRGGILMAQSFGLQQLRPLGEPLSLLEAVAHNSNTSKSTFSASNTAVLAYRPAPRFELAWVDRAGRVLETIGEPDYYRDPALSPDNRQIAVARFDAATGGSSIYLIDTARRVRSRLTTTLGDAAPLWSPDGTQLAFRSARGGVPGIYQVHADGSDQREIFANGFEAAPTAWWRDGSFILAETMDSTGADQILRMPASGPAPREVRAWSTGEDARLSPDQRWIAFVSREGGAREVFVRSAGDAARTWQVSPAGGIEPRWRPDGRELFYVAPDGSLMALDVRAGATFEPGVPRRLFAAGLVGANTPITGRAQYDVSNDGQRFLLNRKVGADTLEVIVNWPALLSR
ncbi:MAG: protein kinase domain-containing protein [Bacteroidales bacterium]